MNLYKIKQDSRGFTLIELLVVIAIIGILSSVVLASLNSARTKARDTRRTADVRQVQTALEFYYDANRAYPSSPDVLLHDALTGPLTPTYISRIPIAPTGNYRYYTASQNPATWYAILVPYETKPACYVCAGDATCRPGTGWWGASICQ